MKAPAGLKTPGRSAWRRAMAALGEQADDRFYDAAARFARAVDRADAIRREWDDAGGPITETFPNGATGEHPLLKALTVAEREAARFGAAVLCEPAAARRRAGAGGRPKGATSAPDRAAPARVTKLRAVAS